MRASTSSFLALCVCALWRWPLQQSEHTPADRGLFTDAGYARSLPLHCRPACDVAPARACGLGFGCWISLPPRCVWSTAHDLHVAVAKGRRCALVPMVSRRVCAALALLLLAIAGAHASEKLKITILASRGLCTLFAAQEPRPGFLGRLQTLHTALQHISSPDLDNQRAIAGLAAAAGQLPPPLSGAHLPFPLDAPCLVLQKKAEKCDVTAENGDTVEVHYRVRRHWPFSAAH